MTTALRWVLAAVLTGHALIHLLGVAKAFGWADVPQLTKPISVEAGVLWLVAGGLTLVAAGLLALGAPTWWWALAITAAAVSQLAIVTSWSDARTGTIVNLVLVLAAGLVFASEGPSSFHAQYRARVAETLGEPHRSPAVLRDAELKDLPGPLAAYVRRSGAVGQPRVVSFRATFHGRIRSGPDEAWMSFTGQQVNTYGSRPKRFFLMDATRSGLPVTVLHVFADATATMRVKLLSLFTMVDASGPEMDRGETVTVFNDLVVMAPGAIVDAPVTWTAVNDLHVRGRFTDGDQTVTAVLTFDADHDLVDFVSDDRARASADGKAFTAQRWSTPLTDQHDVDGHRLFGMGNGVWEPSQPADRFTYLEFHLDAITYNEGAGAGDQATTDPDSVPAIHSAGS